MSIKIKLLLYFLCLSVLIITTGFIFYNQLKNLIEPLTPQSIPRSIERVESSIKTDNIIYHLLYQQQLVTYNLDEYVLTNNNSDLQDYYMNQALFVQLIDETKKTNPQLWQELTQETNQIIAEKENIIKLMQQNNQIAARQLLSGREFYSLKQQILHTINSHHLNFDISTNEGDIVTLKEASKHTIKILFASMNTTIIIFLDALAISLLLAIFSANAISRPINLLKQNMDHITSKNIDANVSKKLLRLKGEVGDLARSFVRLIARLRSTTVSRDKLLEEIDRRVKTENNLREIAKRLEESNRELDQFAYSASHDLRAPLRGIQNIADWIIEDCSELLPDESRKHLELLKKRTQRLDVLINGILDYSRAGRTPARKELVDVNKLLAEVIDSLSPPFYIQVIIDMPMPVFTTYKSLLTQVFLNLINNAIKFHDKPKGYINIGFESQDGDYKFYVKDNGPGIDPKYHNKIFEIFQTLQSRDTIETAGIGLALVKKNVESQGGSIWVNSLVGKGSVFYFTWPF